MSPIRNFPRLHRLAKFLFFLVRGYRPSFAQWLASTEAALGAPLRQIAPVDLKAAFICADGNWNDIEIRGSHVRALGFPLPFRGQDLLARGFRTFLALHRNGYAISREGDALLISNEALSLRATNDEEVSMAQEILVEGCYNLELPGDWHLIDVGANVGFASLFLATKPWLSSVSSFEPFGPTADGFEANVALNPALGKKIRLFRYGLGSNDSFLEVEYDPKYKGSMTIHGLGAWRQSSKARKPLVPVSVKRVSSVLEELAPSFGGRSLLAKIDCEGSEYEILQDLEETGWLRKIRIFVIEWHLRPPTELIARLARGGYSVQARNLVPDLTQGIITAWKSDL